MPTPPASCWQPACRRAASSIHNRLLRRGHRAALGVKLPRPRRALVARRRGYRQKRRAEVPRSTGPRRRGGSETPTTSPHHRRRRQQRRRPPALGAANGQASEAPAELRVPRATLTRARGCRRSPPITRTRLRIERPAIASGRRADRESVGTSAHSAGLSTWSANAGTTGKNTSSAVPPCAHSRTSTRPPSSPTRQLATNKATPCALLSV